MLYRAKNVGNQENSLHFPPHSETSEVICIVSAQFWALNSEAGWNISKVSCSWLKQSINVSSKELFTIKML
jgi:hypothetical protein